MLKPFSGFNTFNEYVFSLTGGDYLGIYWFLLGLHLIKLEISSLHLNSTIKEK